MSTVPVANYRRIFHTEHDSYELNMTARKVDSMTPVEMSKLIISTVKLWLYLARQIEAGVQELPESIAFKSAEMSVENETETELVQHHEPRVTVFDWNHRLELTVHSNSLPQPALELWYSMNDAQAELDKLYPRNAPKPAQEAATAVPHATTYIPENDRTATPKNAPVAPNTPQQPIEGVVMATRAPNPKEKSYPDGQLVEYKINKIVLGTHPTSGSVIYSLWGELGKKYALQTVYVMASNGSEKSYNYKAVESVLEPLGLSIPGKVQAEGNWKLICKASNAGEKQFMNIVSLTAV